MTEAEFEKAKTDLKNAVVELEILASKYSNVVSVNFATDKARNALEVVENLIESFKVELKDETISDELLY